MVKGFNDDFRGYGGWDRPFDLNAGAYGNAIRFPMVWNEYQSAPGAPSTSRRSVRRAVSCIGPGSRQSR